MKIGIAAATSFEVQPLQQFIDQQKFHTPHNFEVLITGIGSVAATYRLTKYVLEQQPDCVLQAGIGGSFTRRYPPGAVVSISEETLGDLGAAEQGGFSDLFDLGLLHPSDMPFINKRLENPHMQFWDRCNIPAAKGLTVNEITTLPDRIALLRQKYNSDIESMEGAALHYVCLQQQINFMQFRAVSNFVGERDKNKWKLRESIQNLNDTMIQVVQQIIQL